MDLVQTKIVGLTMELDLKAKEFQMLCEKLEDAKKKITDPSDERLLWFKDLFEKNNKEIVEINRKLKELQDEEIKKEEQYKTDNIFKNKKTPVAQSEATEEKPDPLEYHLVAYKQSFFSKLINKVKGLFFK